MPYPEIVDASSTGQAGQAYRALAEAMPDHLHVEAFSLEVGSPEYAIYEAVFRSTGIHQKSPSGEWFLAMPPHSGWRGAWTAMTDGFDHATEARVNLTDMASQISAQAVDTNDEIVRLLLIAGLLTRGEDILLYENQNLITSLDSTVAVRLSTRIDDFSVKNAQTCDGQRKALLDILIRRLKLAPLAEGSRLLAVVVALYRQLQALPAYTQQTTHSLSRDTLAIRQCFRGASEPDVLIFETLPIILMIGPFSGPGRPSIVAAGEYTGGLLKAIQELQSAYPALLDDIRQSLAKAVTSDAISLPELRKDLTARARKAAGRELESELATLVNALMGSGDDEQWLEAIASMATGGSSPKIWSDETVDTFRTQIDHIGGTFKRELSSL